MNAVWIIMQKYYFSKHEKLFCLFMYIFYLENNIEWKWPSFFTLGHRCKTIWGKQNKHTGILLSDERQVQGHNYIHVRVCTCICTLSDNKCEASSCFLTRYLSCRKYFTFV